APAGVPAPVSRAGSPLSVGQSSLLPSGNTPQTARLPPRTLEPSLNSGACEAPERSGMMLGNLDPAEIERLLRSQRIAHLGVRSDERIYVFPIGYGYDGAFIYL